MTRRGEAERGLDESDVPYGPTPVTLEREPEVPVG
jgi:hypothetical protein